MSEEYFSAHLLAGGSRLVVTTLSFMTPEAYVLEAIARGFPNQASEAELLVLPSPITPNTSVYQIRLERQF